ncbi:hypothetical protein H6762_04865 [Candidatus Nomurabacteria bacterium]|nr:hypothetical protein [Candidatus Nomurabacteria bacterium]
MEPIFTETSTYKNKQYKSELFIDNNYNKIAPITQVHAICFIDEDTVIFQEFKDGTLGNLGGGFEKDEGIEDVLKRELIEEGQLELVSWKAFGYEKISRLDKPNQYDYFLRTVARVKLINKPINDPCGKSIGRVIVPYINATERLGWKRKGELLLEYAKKTYSKLT